MYSVSVFIIFGTQTETFNMRPKLILGIFLLFPAIISFSQEKKQLDHNAYQEWRRIKDHSISRDGEFITYYLKSNAEANDILMLHDQLGKTLLQYERGTKPQFSFSSDYLFFTINPDLDTLKTKRREKVKKDKLPMDSLAIRNLKSGALRKISRLKSYKVPEKWSGWFAYQYLPEADSTNKKLLKKLKKEKAFQLVISSNTGASIYEYPAVTEYVLSEKGGKIAFVTKGDSTYSEGVYVFDTNSESLSPIFRAKGKYYSFSWDEVGSQLTFVSDLDTTKAPIHYPNLHYWKSDSAMIIASGSENGKSKDLLISEHFGNHFSKDGKTLYFGYKEMPIVQDTSLLEEEIVNVEVWSYQDKKLHTQQKIDKEADSKRSYTVAYDVGTNQIIQLGNATITEVIESDEGNSSNLLGINDQPYGERISWEGFPYYKDLYAINKETGSSTLIKSEVRGSGQMSPGGKYAYWYDVVDSAWFTYNFATKKETQITNNSQVPFYNERHDTPSHPYPYGVMTWTENDNKVLIYDRWDIWQVDPKGESDMTRITPNGREKEIKYRYIKLDDEERFVKSGQKLLLGAFYEDDKSEAIFELTFKKGAKPVKKISGDFQFDNFKKAQESNEIIYSKENFNIFPDLLITSNGFKKFTKISNVNPQQKDYSWGSIELYKWTSLDGQELEGMLVKPGNFDPNKKYPLMVNFYEKSADRLNNHRDPFPHRSTINYSFYASRGYVIFNPDVHYKDGYPGESAYNCVISGINSLIEDGFVDKDRIGVQGHSWGGYQVAYLVTKTDIFKCAESGAPVPNMISAYGGIRWWTGLSRMFQYEHTQSRIGGTLWEYPQRFIENSPIFYIDKINTPVLIMHNDQDGHVPWYQGIEFFVAMRRLGKPSWFLNYQGEPHWPQKLQNRIDFNIRMQQYFDHYLMDAPMPKWMKDGVPALKMGIDQGLDD